MSDIRNDYVFTWKITNYSRFLNYLVGDPIISPMFTLKIQHSTQWCLKFYPKGNLQYVSCYLQCNTSEEVTGGAAIKFRIEIVNNIGNVVTGNELNTSVFSKQYPMWGFVSFMDINKLMKEMDSWKNDVLTLRCRIEYDNVNKIIAFGSEAINEIINQRYFEWSITTPKLNYSECILFPFSDVCDIRVNLKILLKGLEISFIFVKSSSYSPEAVWLKISLYDKRDSIIISKCAKHLFEDGQLWKCPIFITKNSLESCYLDSKTYDFKLKCEMYTSDKNIPCGCTEKLHFMEDSEHLTDSYATVQYDFKSLFIDKKYCDVIIRAGETDFHVHKLVLRARSPVYDAMFDQNMLENETGKVNVTDIDGETMKAFLEFLYTDTVDNMEYKSAKKLLFAADKYQVPLLLDKCATFLQSVLSAENACEIISIADSVNCECLKSNAFEFIVSNADKILMRADWKQWIKENTELASEILFELSTGLKSK